MLNLVFVAAVGSWVGFTNPLFHFPLAALALPMCLAWIGFRAVSWRNAFAFGWLAGLLAGIGSLYWVVIPVQTYGGLPWFIALPCPFLLAALMATYYGVFSVTMYFAGQRLDGILLCLLAGLTWSSLEILTGTLLSGFPWMNLSSAFVAWPQVIQAASLVGGYGLSGILAMISVAALLYSTYQSALWLAVGTLSGLCLFGLHRMKNFTETNPKITVSIVQGNIDQGAKWAPQYQMATVQKYTRLTLEAIERARPELVVWPETAMPFYFEDNTPLAKAVKSLAQTTRTPIITGSPAYRITDMKTRSFILFNRAWLVDDTGRTLQYYDKEHLVPFGEYMPFEEWVPFEKLVQAAGNFLPGQDNKPIAVNGVALGMQICYEGIFPELAQQQVERGATVFINISNDAWFGKTSAPRQHLFLTTLRAVEQGRWIVRSTNTGISAFINPLGEITAVSNQFQAESLSSTIKPRTQTTFFHRHYALIKQTIFACTIAGLGLLTFGRKRKEQQESI